MNRVIIIVETQPDGLIKYRGHKADIDDQVIMADTRYEDATIPPSWADLAGAANLSHLVDFPEPKRYDFDTMLNAPDGAYWRKSSNGHQDTCNVSTCHSVRIVQVVGNEYSHKLSGPHAETPNWLRMSTFFGPITPPEF